MQGARYVRRPSCPSFTPSHPSPRTSATGFPSTYWPASQAPPPPSMLHVSVPPPTPRECGDDGLWSGARPTAVPATATGCPSGGASMSSVHRCGSSPRPGPRPSGRRMCSGTRSCVSGWRAGCGGSCGHCSTTTTSTYPPTASSPPSSSTARPPRRLSTSCGGSSSSTRSCSRTSWTPSRARTTTWKPTTASPPPTITTPPPTPTPPPSIGPVTAPRRLPPPSTRLEPPPTPTVAAGVGARDGARSRGGAGSGGAWSHRWIHSGPGRHWARC
mmetsp:Transcript_9233/g.15841  ORF Transcript_9233/g.15841 Transcript_9233/m.15841 type:complete len:272 (-) Transcript_9233:450-1265(-)